ncbi:MAG TPA: asparagine synthase (glutamine-hydrolyzing) [Gemmatimonadales bacterium]|nr:asparagine synthase (glutamine-hydrolyzing) [Gemmatimonadales bacterium]
MCGVAGRFHPARLPDAPGWAVRARALLAHRGPDGSGHFQDDCCELVHRRLALIDLSPTGHQPMGNEDQSVWVVFNGEIYNHADLRRGLRRAGHEFRGSSDTEVLVHLYEEEGERLVDQLRGIFAFALYDRPRRRLLLGRDRFGVKPLFYAVVDQQWVFASEIKAIVALPGFRPGLDRQACYDFLGLGYVPEPATGFSNVHAISKGSVVSVSPTGHQVFLYSRVVPSPAPDTSDGAAVERASQGLLAAVGRQAVADVPVAALLSGGIDSSLVVAAHGRVAGRATATFNVRFPDARHDETTLARAVARHCQTEHHVIDADARALTPEALLSLIRHFDQPFADTSLIPMAWVSEAVRDHGIKCALSGDGGDEAFGGYARFWRAHALMRLMQAPAWLRRMAQSLGGALTARTRDWGRQLAKATALADAGRDDIAQVLAGMSSYLTEDHKADLVLPDARTALLPAARHFNGNGPHADLDLESVSRRMTDVLFAVSLPSDMLRKVDMMSMRAGLEVRVPMLDEDLVDFGVTLPHRLKTDGRVGKLILRGVARRWLPTEVVRHPKHGFSIPLDVMVPDAFHALVADLVCGRDARTRPFLNGPLVQGWLAAFAAARNGVRPGYLSREGLYQRVFTLVSLEQWLRDHRLTW